MVRNLAVWIVFAVALQTGCQPMIPVEEPQSPMVGKLAPDFTAPTLDGESFKLSESIGSNKVVLLDFWATWCGPCLAELPVLTQIAEDYKDRGVVLYAINQGENAKTIRSFLERTEFQMNIVLDSVGDISSQYVVDGIPHLVIIDQRGIVKHVHVGYHAKVDEVIRRELDELLTSNPPAA